MRGLAEAPSLAQPAAPVGRPDLEDLFGGLAFLDGSFSPTRLLTAVATLRRWNEGTDAVLAAYLTPQAGLRAARATGYSYPDVGQRRIAPTEIELIGAALGYILHARPDWVRYLSLPVTVEVADTDRMFGFSCIAMPQHIVLGSISFSSVEVIAEQYLHELTHNWLYLIQELWPFEDGDCEKSFVLPSGTPGKSVTGVLDAAYVMAVLSSFYGALGNGDRVVALRRYVRGCVEMLAARDDLTPVGQQVWSRLSRVCEHSYE